MGRIVSTNYLSLLDSVKYVVEVAGYILPGHSPVKITENKIKTMLYNHQQVIPVKKYTDEVNEIWATLSREDSKRF